MARIIGIAAVARNGAIGKEGQIPWRYPPDLKFFKERTLNNACVMGRRTWLSLKRPLPDRLNLVLSGRSEAEEKQEDSVIFLRDAASVLTLSRYLACDLFIIGGEQVYRTFLPYIETWVITEIPLSVDEADAFMPKDFLKGFTASDSMRLDEELKVTFYRRV